MTREQATAQAARANARSTASALVPERQLVERVTHEQRVVVKVFPSISEPCWSGWVREVLNAPMELWRVADEPRD